ncbi:MAG: class I SAM-dependent methyltransferase [Caldilineaceae bacterium]|nr:class I SAM-dependent methyltransferase [Caldilineaceae bacterium]
MTDSVSRFSDRVDNYRKYRPGYPPEILAFLHRTINLSPFWTVADIGSGTGIFAEIFLEYGNTVIGVEPNAAMRAAAELELIDHPHFVAVDGTAEATSLAPATVDLITVAQAFHWFDAEKARREFERILRPGSWVVLAWNSRRLDSTPFLRGYESLLRTTNSDYAQKNEKNVGDDDIAAFFGGGNHFGTTRFDNVQRFDWDGLRGRALSSSYAPAAGHPDHEPFLTQLRQLFDDHQVNGRIAYEYDTRLYYGQLNRTVTL